MKTKRNQLEVLLAPTDFDMADEIDTIYEVCDAEFPNDSATYNTVMKMAAKNSQSAKILPQLEALFLPKVKEIAKRDEMMAGVPESNFAAIARRLAKDWDNTTIKDYRDQPQP